MVDHDPPPVWFILKLITVERLDLYSYVPPPETNIPISLQPFLVEYSVPTEDNIE